jgi:hypothetical protein
MGAGLILIRPAQIIFLLIPSQRIKRSKTTFYGNPAVIHYLEK